LDTRQETNMLVWPCYEAMRTGIVCLA